MAEKDLYLDLLERYKDHPYGIMIEYRDDHSNREKFIRYSYWIMQIMCLVSFCLGLYLIKWIFESFESEFLIVPLCVVVGGVTTIITWKLLRINDEGGKIKEYSDLKKTYEQAFLVTKYPTQSDRVNNTRGLTSKWFFVRLYTKYKIYGWAF